MPRFTLPFLTPALLALSLLAPPLAAQQSTEPAPLPEMSEIEAAWQREDFETVRAGLKRLAEEDGSALAQFRYGRVLVEGRGGPRDLAGAVDWLEKAVAQNHAEAALLLGRILLTTFAEDATDAPERDPERAAGLLQLAAARGLAQAQVLLAQLYLNGAGVAQDDATAFSWMLAAAEQQDPEAQAALVRFYNDGIGTERNEAEAVRWLTTAAENGNRRAQFSLAQAYETGAGVEKSPARAADWYRAAADGGMPLAQRRLGMAYLTGNGAPQDAGEAIVWLTRAAQGGDPGAMYNLGYIYAAGEAVAQDMQEAARWYDLASEYGLGRAQVAFGALHETGTGVAQDFDKAVELYRRALDTTDRGLAARRLGQLAAAGQLDGRYAPGRMVPWVQVALQAGDDGAEAWMTTQAGAGLRDAQFGLAGYLLTQPERAGDGVAYLRQAAKAGDPDAQRRLGEMHMTGDLVELDYVAAYGWFNIAATFGADEAAKLRETARALMTPEQIAAGQAFSRRWFAEEEPQPPATVQTMREIDPERSDK